MPLDDQTDFYSRELFAGVSSDVLLRMRREHADALRARDLPGPVRAEVESFDRAAARVLMRRGIVFNPESETQK